MRPRSPDGGYRQCKVCHEQAWMTPSKLRQNHLICVPCAKAGGKTAAGMDPKEKLRSPDGDYRQCEVCHEQAWMPPSKLRQNWLVCTSCQKAGGKKAAGMDLGEKLRSPDGGYRECGVCLRQKWMASSRLRQNRFICRPCERAGGRRAAGMNPGEKQRSPDGGYRQCEVCHKQAWITPSRLRQNTLICVSCERAGGKSAYGMSPNHHFETRMQAEKSLLLSKARIRASQNGLPYTINHPDDLPDIPDICPALGIPLELKANGGTSPSLDRLVPELGYTPENVRWISYRANQIKNIAEPRQLRNVATFTTYTMEHSPPAPGDERTCNQRENRRRQNQVRTARHRAAERGVPCDLEHYTELHWPDYCPALGIPLDRRDNRRTPSLDRVVPENGYTRGNVWVISWLANQIKSNATADELFKVAAYTYREIEGLPV